MVLNAPLNELMNQFGLNDRHCAALRCSFEVSSCLHNEALPHRVRLGSESEIVSYIEFHLRHKSKESVAVVFLDERKQIIETAESLGNNAVKITMDLKELVRRSIENCAAFVILAHNHPSGDYTPSRADIAATMNIRNALSCIGVTLLDHLIVGNHCYSMSLGRMVSNPCDTPKRQKLNIYHVH